MDLYDQVKKQWQIWAVRSGEDLDLRLDNFRILFAYNSGKIENAAISYHDTREIFENGRVVGYTGDPRTLFELQNQKVCYDFLREKIPVKEPLSIPLILEIHRALTEGTYDERRYLVNGERPGTFKKQDYVTGIHEVGSYPEEVEGDLTELIGEVNSVGPKAPLKAGTYLHARFENIHPFADGNGRVGRTLLNYWLMINDYPPMIIYEEDKKAYYDALQQYDEQESLDALVRFLEAQTVKTWARVMKLSPMIRRNIKESNFICCKCLASRSSGRLFSLFCGAIFEGVIVRIFTFWICAKTDRYPRSEPRGFTLTTLISYGFEGATL